MSGDDPLADWRCNPFFVLEVEIEASRIEVERAGQKLLALLAVGNVGAGRYETPLGPAIRDADLVRQSLATLRDPHERVLHELWANIARKISGEPHRNATGGWEAAEYVFGRSGKCPG